MTDKAIPECAIDREETRTHATATATTPGRFTLIELLVVMVIIGILIAFILVAAMDGVRRAEERATQSLIAKLETAINDRLEALLSRRAEPTWPHRRMATSSVRASGRTSPACPLVIALYDLTMSKAELPDVFVYVPPRPPQLRRQSPEFPERDYLGHAFSGRGTSWRRSPTTSCRWATAPWTSCQQLRLRHGHRRRSHNPRGDGDLRRLVHRGGRASTRTSATSRKGYDGVDNDGDGLVDEWAEGVVATQRDRS